jgi:uncharacterized membrane protein SirB2
MFSFWGSYLMVGFLIVSLSVLFAHVRRKGKKGTRTEVAAPPSDSVLVEESFKDVVAQQRRERSVRSGNLRTGPGTGFLSKVNLYAFAFMIAIAVISLVLIVVSFFDAPENTEAVASSVTADDASFVDTYAQLGILLVIVVGAVLFIRRRARKGTQLKAYRRLFRASGVDSSPLVSVRETSETFFEHNNYGFPPSGGFNWISAMWDRFGGSLLGREMTVMKVAADAGSDFEPWSAVTDGFKISNFHVGESYFLWQLRNSMVFSDSSGLGYPVRFGDMNVVVPHTFEINGVSRPRPELKTFSFLETWFPSDYSLTVVPDSRFGVSKLLGAGDRMETGQPIFDKRFDVRTNSQGWARLVLNPAVMMKLLNSSGVWLQVDAGKITIASQGRWLEPNEIFSVAELVREIAVSARSAEA